MTLQQLCLNNRFRLLEHTLVNKLRQYYCIKVRSIDSNEILFIFMGLKDEYYKVLSEQQYDCLTIDCEVANT